MILDQKEFQEFSKNYWETREKPKYWGVIGVYTNSKGEEIAYKVLTVNVNENYGALAAIQDGFQNELDENQIVKEYFSWLNDNDFHANVEALKNKEADKISFFTITEEDLSCKPKDILDIHIRLSLLSRRIKKPNTINLDGIFTILPNLVWTDSGPYDIQDWNEKFIKGENYAQVIAVDKIPPLFLWNPIPEGVRVANTDMIRSGAYLSNGTTVMHYGFINFNAGTLGESMVEGRISAGTVVDQGTDIGAGAGFLRTLSGGNNIKISTGKKCLIGAMAECGIPLGDNCIIAVGTTFAPGTPVYDTRDNSWKKAIDLANQDNLLIWQNAKTGRLEALHNTNNINLNEELHKN